MVGQTRRRVLGSAAKVAAVGAVAAASGCSQAGDLLGGGPSLEVSEVDSEVTNWGDILLRISVENTDDETGSGTLYGQIDVQGGDTYTESQDITVPAGETNQYEMQVQIEFSDSLGASGYQHDAWVEMGESTE